MKYLITALACFAMAFANDIPSQQEPIAPGKVLFGTSEPGAFFKEDPSGGHWITVNLESTDYWGFKIFPLDPNGGDEVGMFLADEFRKDWRYVSVIPDQKEEQFHIIQLRRKEMLAILSSPQPFYLELIPMKAPEQAITVFSDHPSNLEQLNLPEFQKDTDHYDPVYCTKNLCVGNWTLSNHIYGSYCGSGIMRKCWDPAVFGVQCVHWNLNVPDGNLRTIGQTATGEPCQALWYQQIGGSVESCPVRVTDCLGITYGITVGTTCP